VRVEKSKTGLLWTPLEKACYDFIAYVEGQVPVGSTHPDVIAMRQYAVEIKRALPPYSQGD